MKSINKIIISIIISLFMFSCSSSSTSNIVEGKASLKTSISITDIENIPANANLMFRMYNNRGKLLVDKLIEPQKELNIFIDKLDIGVFVNVQLAVVEDGKQDTRLYYGDVVIRKMEEQIVLPHMEMTIAGDAPEFLLTRIEDDIFYTKCYTCHNSVKKDANLDLSKWNSYDNLVNVAADDNTKNILITPSSLSASYCYQILEHPNLLPDMISTPLTKDEFALLKRWINAGAPRY